VRKLFTVMGAVLVLAALSLPAVAGGLESEAGPEVLATVADAVGRAALDERVAVQSAEGVARIPGDDRYETAANYSLVF
jgi:hypothetical protein